MGRRDELVPRQPEEQYSVRLVLITASVTEVSSFSLQMGSFAIGTVAATSLIFMALLASGSAALGKYFLKLVEAFAIEFWWEFYCRIEFYKSLPIAHMMKVLPKMHAAEAKLLPRFSQDGVREAYRLRLPRHYLLQREESVVVRVPRMVQGGGGMPGCSVLVRRESLGADAGHPLPAAERNGRHESGRAAPKGRQHVLYDETANKIR